jgi:hypothetical protein
MPIQSRPRSIADEVARDIENRQRIEKRDEERKQEEIRDKNKLRSLVGRTIVDIVQDGAITLTLDDGREVSFSYDGGYTPDMDISERKKLQQRNCLNCMNKTKEDYPYIDCKANGYIPHGMRTEDNCNGWKEKKKVTLDCEKECGVIMKCGSEGRKECLELKKKGIW